LAALWQSTPPQPTFTRRFFGNGGRAQKGMWVSRLIFAAKIEPSVVAI
jgi:hypothetical protein